MTAPWRLRGRVDLDRLATPAQPIDLSGGATTGRVQLPGVDLQWRPGDVRVAYAHGLLAMACGRPRMHEAHDAADDAAQWIERYRRQGVHAPADIGGAFAVVLVDLAEPHVSLFVDRFAMETMCYRAANGSVSFSDSCAAVDGARNIDAQAIFDYLYFHVIPAPSTIFTDVRRVEHAHVVVVDRSRTRSEPYWTPAFEEHDHGHLQQRMREFVETVRDAVAEEADEPRTACFLSGGTDSSTVSGMLARIRGEPAHAYSIGFESKGYDEMAYARIAASHFSLSHHEYYVTPDDLVGAIPRIAASLDQPFGNSSVLPAYFCALRAKEDGFTRMLAGDGGDELFGGNSRYATQKLFELYHGLPRWLRHGVLEPPAMRWALFRKVPGLRQAGGYIRHARVPMPERMESFNLLRQVGSDPLTPEFRSRVDVGHPHAMQNAVWESLPRASIVNRMLAYDWRFTLADSDLPKVRTATRLAGASVGYPLLSRELTDLSLGLPPAWKVKGVKLRWFFKKALRDVLPPEVIAKKKHGFGLPFGAWCLQHPHLRRLAQDSLESLGARNIVRPEFAREMMVERLREAPGYFGEMVWILMMLEQWMQARANVGEVDS